MSDLQAFLVFSQHPAGVYCAGKPLEGVVYCFYELVTRYELSKYGRISIVNISGWHGPRFATPSKQKNLTIRAHHADTIFISSLFDVRIFATWSSSSKEFALHCLTSNREDLGSKM